MSTKEQHKWAMPLIQKAVLAPSSHNTQPWLFRVAESAIDLYADRTRALPVNDPDDRELSISCGCALMNLRVAAGVESLDVRVELLPAPDEPDWLARMSFTRKTGALVEEAALAASIEQRRTHRKRFLPREVDAAALDELIEAARREGASLRPLATAAARQKAASLVAEGDAAQWANPSWRRELAAWMHPRRRGDGLTVPSLAAPVTQLVVRTFDLGGGVGAKDRELAEASPLLAVLCTEGDQPRDWLLAGQALERVLLVACRHGLQASYLNQPIQVVSLRPKLQDLVGGGFPQILLRLGHPVDVVPAAPRREVADVIEEAAVHSQGQG
jgi:nitroreductase